MMRIGVAQPRASVGESAMHASKTVIYIFWPSFLVACAAEALFFTVVDPSELVVFGEPVTASRIGIYSVGFFLLWAFGAASSAVTCFLQRSAAEVNQCPLPGPERPLGCPKRDDEEACC
jgi:hypothetical protein